MCCTLLPSFHFRTSSLALRWEGINIVFQTRCVSGDQAICVFTEHFGSEGVRQRLSSQCVYDLGEERGPNSWIEEGSMWVGLKEQPLPPALWLRGARNTSVPGWCPRGEAQGPGPAWILCPSGSRAMSPPWSACPPHPPGCQLGPEGRHAASLSKKRFYEHLG